MSGQYDDIIQLPHHVSLTRPQMSMQDRAAQFSPFAALTGYDAAVKETARLTEEKIELDDEELNILNIKFQMLQEQINKDREVSITFFQPDERKSGGAYVTTAGLVKKMDAFERQIIMWNGAKIPMDDVLDIEGDMFASL
jgi:hypothetical protein